MKAKNGFVAGENCFVAAGATKHEMENLIISNRYTMFLGTGAVPPRHDQYRTASRNNPVFDSDSRGLGRFQCFPCNWRIDRVDSRGRPEALEKVIHDVAKSTPFDAGITGKAARYLIARRRNTAVSNDARFGKSAPTGNQSGRPIIERLMTGTELRVSSQADEDGEPAIICETQGAMTQQSSDPTHGHESVPQKLPQLVGYRDPNACPAAASHRPRRDGAR